jgi:two-component system chemotaxis response regulator CheB
MLRVSMLRHGHLKTTVLIADDSAFMRASLTRMIESDEELTVIATASDGLEALSKINSLQPDVVTLDIDMPGMDGLEILKRVMSDLPRPIIIVSSVSRGQTEATIEALALGAFDCVAKSLNYGSEDVMKVREELIGKIKAAAAAKALRECSPRRSYAPMRYAAAAAAPSAAIGAKQNVQLGHPATMQNSKLKQAFPIASLNLPANSAANSAPNSAPNSVPSFIPSRAPASVIAIGTSTGGPNALQIILSGLPAKFPVPIIAVQHMPAGFIHHLAERLNRFSSLKVCEAVQGQPLRAGHVYLAPAGKHLTVRRLSRREVVVCLSLLPSNVAHVPSVDIMMLSIAEVFQSSAMGVVLTGMGTDGAEGMQAIFHQGGRTLGQDEATCIVYGMPRSCEERGILNEVAPLPEISSRILAAVRVSSPSSNFKTH